MPHILTKPRSATMPDGKPHPFIWYGHRSQYVLHELGVFHSLMADRLRWCWLLGCKWKTIEMRGIDSAEGVAQVTAFMPHVVLECARCHCGAMPWKLWDTEMADREQAEWARANTERLRRYFEQEEQEEA